jgi:uronate dehydrogenase
MQRVLITGAAGKIGSTLRQGLQKKGFYLRLCDIDPLSEVNDGEEILQFDILDFIALKHAMKDVDCVVHMAGIPHEDSWSKILQTNIQGTANVFEAARQMGVKRIIFASSNHTIGFYRKEKILDDSFPLRPDTFYGVSKVLGEALGRLYADKHGMSVACLRIGSFEERPKTARHLRTWISPRDMVQLTLRCIEAPNYHFIIAYGVSANTQSCWDNGSIDFLNYRPQDNAEDYASSCIQHDDTIADQFHGGPYCSIAFDGDPSFID